MEVLDMKKWEKFTDIELEQMVKESRSTRDLAIKIGYAPNGGSGVAEVNKMLREKNFDSSHFTGQAWNKDNFDYSRFQYGKVIKIADAVSAIAALRGRKCERCGRETWEGAPIPLEVHHEDGDHLNNRLSNLKLLCCNCHALTKNYKGKNINKTEEIDDETFIEALKTTNNVRQALLKLGLTAAGGNYERAYNLINKYNIIQQ